MVFAWGGRGKILVLASALIFHSAAVSPAQQPQPAPTATIGADHGRIEPPRANYAFPDGRTYVYSGEWHVITAGTGTVRMEVDGKERKVVATAESAGAVNVLFPVHDRFESRFDPRTFCSLSRNAAATWFSLRF